MWHTKINVIMKIRHVKTLGISYYRQHSPQSAHWIIWSSSSVYITFLLLDFVKILHFLIGLSSNCITVKFLKSAGYIKKLFPMELNLFVKHCQNRFTKKIRWLTSTELRLQCLNCLIIFGTHSSSTDKISLHV